MQTTINEKQYAFETLDTDETAVDLIRSRCGLTGTKLVCGSGVCGACTVLVDGTPMVGCLLPAQQMEGKAVETVEAYDAENLHPVQRAFMAHDGLQCGYCTPGFIVEGIAFYKRWRVEHGLQRPSPEQITDALAGHLCRCGAYAGIYAALQAACAGEFDAVTETHTQRVDALEKVTGAARYTTDIQLPGQLCGKILRAPHAYARVLSIDCTPALALAGVKAAIPFPGQDSVVRYVGQSIAAVAAVDEATATAALKRIKVEYEILPHVIGIPAAMAEDAPDIWRGHRREAPGASEGFTLPGAWKQNVRTGLLNMGGLRPARARQLVAAAKDKEGQHVIESRYTNAIQIHTALEPHCAVAHWPDETQVQLYISTQAVTAVQQQAARHLRLPVENVTVIAEHVGGGFGAKHDLYDEAIAALELARCSGAPVAVIPLRPEEMSLGGFRPGGYFDLKLAASSDGELLALVSHAYSDGGVAIGNITSALTAMGYSGGARDLRDHDVVSNHAPGKPFRGPGGTGALWAMEQAVDQMAHELQLDALALRRKWTDNENRLKLYDWVESLEVWQNRPEVGSQNGRYRRGVGVAFGQWIYLYDPEATVQIDAGPDGLVVRCATQDIGNGVRTTLARIVAEVFTVEQTKVQVLIGRSTYPHGPVAGGSRVTVSVFEPAERAAHLLRDRLFGLAAETFDLSAAEIAPGGIRHSAGLLSWMEIMPQIPPQQVSIKRGADPQLVQHIGAFFTNQMGMGVMFGQGLAHGAVVVEVEVDILSGKTRVPRVWENLAIGRAYLPDMARSQVYGGILQGIGYALYEEKVFDHATGNNLVSNLQDYHIPGIGDTPEMFVEFTDGGLEHAKGQGIGLSELCTIPVAAAVANAVYNATAIRFTQSPLTPERLITALYQEPNRNAQA